MKRSLQAGSLVLALLATLLMSAGAALAADDSTHKSPQQASTEIGAQPAAEFEGKSIEYERRFEYADYCVYSGSGPEQCFEATPGTVQRLDSVELARLADCNGDNSRWVYNYDGYNRGGPRQQYNDVGYRQDFIASWWNRMSGFENFTQCSVRYYDYGIPAPAGAFSVAWPPGTYVPNLGAGDLNYDNDFDGVCLSATNVQQCPLG